MIREIRISGLRGIESGGIADLTELSVLVGPNGCGKSTILDALLLALAQEPGEAIIEVVNRRQGLPGAASWLVYRQEDPAQIAVGTREGGGRICDISISSRDTSVVSWESQVEPGNVVHCEVEFTPKPIIQTQTKRNVQPLAGVKHVHLVEVAPGPTQKLLERAYTEAVNRGARKSVFDLLAAVVPGLESVEILTDKAGQPVTHLVFDWGGVPVGLAGDGMLALARLCFELAAQPSGLALVEEPEAHQHPRSMFQGAKAIAAAVRRGIQVIVSTHSIEFIDALIDALEESELDKLSVHRISLQEHHLVSTVSAGEDLIYFRRQVEEDLR